MSQIERTGRSHAGRTRRLLADVALGVYKCTRYAVTKDGANDSPDD